MKSLAKLKNSSLSFLYRRLAKPIFFRFDPEHIHKLTINFASMLGKSSFGRALTRTLFFFDDKSLSQKITGLEFPNPIGLAAGFDKNGRLKQILPELGFGFIELGSVTALPCAGNPGKRLWRLPEDRGLIVHLGLANDGCVAMLKQVQGQSPRIPVGISIAATNCPETANEHEAIKDFLTSYSLFSKEKCSDYITINISCPNAFGGESFLEPDRLSRLLTAISKARVFYSNTQPIFLKLSTTLSDPELDKIIAIAREQAISGFICSNLLKKHSPVGGVSGPLVKDQATDLIRRLYKKTGKEFIIIGCGGISSAEDAYEKIKAGASLLQLITALIYEGPQLISQINSGLVELLHKDGYSSISEAIGKE